MLQVLDARQQARPADALSVRRGHAGRRSRRGVNVAISDCGLRVADWIMRIRISELRSPQSEVPDVSRRTTADPGRPPFPAVRLSRARPSVLLAGGAVPGAGRQGGGGPAQDVRSGWRSYLSRSWCTNSGTPLMQRTYGGRPWITLYGFGGLASCNDCDRRPRSQILISLAGPCAGFFLAAFVIADSVRVAATSRDFELSWMPIVMGADSIRRADCRRRLLAVRQYHLGPGESAAGLSARRRADCAGTVYAAESAHGHRAVAATIGRRRRPGRGVCGLEGRFYSGLMFGILAYGNFQSLQFYRNHWR